MNEPKYTVTVELDENGEQVIELPPELLNSLEWDENTQLEWIVEGDSILVREAEISDPGTEDTRISSYATIGVLGAFAIGAVVFVIWALQGSI